MVCRESKTTNAGQFQEAFPGHNFEQMVGRGYLYCEINPKQGITCVHSGSSTVHNRKSPCQWTICFRFDVATKIFTVDETLSNFRHSHPVNRDAVRASSRLCVSYEREMDADEIALAMSCGPARLGVTKARDFMCLGKLLRRLLQKGFDAHFGTDSWRLNVAQYALMLLIGRSAPTPSW